MYHYTENKYEHIQVNPHKLAVLHRLPYTPCEEPSVLAMDLKTRRVFAGCGNKMMAVINADTGKIVATPTIGDGVDANAFDPATNYAFSSNGEGTPTAVHEDSPDKYSVVEHVPTKKYTRN